MFSEHQKELLNAALAQGLTQSRVQGRHKNPETHQWEDKRVDYLPGQVVIRRLNEIFGFGGWSYEITDTTLKTWPKAGIHTFGKKKGEAYIHQMALSTARIRLTILGAGPKGQDIVREDIGVVNNTANDTQSSIEVATKGAVTDGLKRCARTFGLQFGNGLYGHLGPSAEQHPMPEWHMAYVALRKLIQKRFKGSQHKEAADLVKKEKSWGDWSTSQLRAAYAHLEEQLHLMKPEEWLASQRTGVPEPSPEVMDTQEQA